MVTTSSSTKVQSPGKSGGKETSIFRFDSRTLRTPFSEDMDQILAPTSFTIASFSTGIDPSFSADDSIIQRVEEEIAAARRIAGRSALLHPERRHQASPSDAELLTGLRTPPEDKNPGITSANSSFDQHVTNLIDNDFDDAPSAPPSLLGPDVTEVESRSDDPVLSYRNRESELGNVPTMEKMRSSDLVSCMSSSTNGCQQQASLSDVPEELSSGSSSYKSIDPSLNDTVGMHTTAHQVPAVQLELDGEGMEAVLSTEPAEEVRETPACSPDKSPSQSSTLNGISSETSSEQSMVTETHEQSLVQGLTTDNEDEKPVNEQPSGIESSGIQTLADRQFEEKKVEDDQGKANDCGDDAEIDSAVMSDNSLSREKATCLYHSPSSNRIDITNDPSTFFIASSSPSSAHPDGQRIRFRKPFPVLKPPEGPRSDDEIIRDHATSIPEVRILWMKPKQELKQLIVAAMGTSLQRRSNACGALKVLTTKKKNQLTLVRTDGFLNALVFTASQEIAVSDLELAIDARSRAISCMRNVCSPKENRLQVLKHPGLIECLVKVLEEDVAEAKVLACTALALLAKSPECRPLLVKACGLLAALSHTLVGGPPIRTIASSVENKHTDATPNSSGLASDDASDYSGSSTDDGISEDEPSIGSIDQATKPAAALNSIKTRNENLKDDYYQHARSSACAALVQLSRSCEVSSSLARSKGLVRSCVRVSREISNPIHTKSIEILRNMSLFPGNTELLTKSDGVVLTFVAGAHSHLAENRISSLRALQNLSSNSASRPLLATKTVLNLMTTCAMRQDPSEREAAVATLYNISTEPSTVVAITNTKNVIATLVHLAHSPESASNIRLLACDALATTSLWLQTLAGTGKVPKGVASLPLPSQKTHGWDRWD